MSARSIGCKTCGKPLSSVNVSGYCRKHYGAACNAEQTRQQAKKQWADPAYRARTVHSMRESGQGRVRWCPIEYRDDYRRLKRVKHLSAADARLAIEELIAADARRHARTGVLPQSNRAALCAAVDGR